MPSSITIDSHVHFWNFDPVRDAWITEEMRVLRKDFLPEDIIKELNQNNIGGYVAVQAGQSETETNFLVELATKFSEIKGVIGWIDLRNEQIQERLDHFSQFKIIKGWRHIVQSEPENFLLGKEFQRGLKAFEDYDYTYDILIYHHQLKSALKFVECFPGQKFILDHCAKPSIRDADIKDWKLMITEMALFPDVYCKVSGLLTEAKWKQWSPGDFYPYLDTVFEAFGHDRVLFGSDWPVILLSGTYSEWKNLLLNYMLQFSREEQSKFFGLNALRVYNL